ncbi:MAG: glycogen synthase GlgA [Candidatus Coatesbacteria bacterium]|nr:glycogen synthase GlgA [Candidatus Coatesbacteria bacterium]
MKIIFTTSEIYPFSKTGGLADVSFSLPKALSSLDNEIMIISPLYKCIDRKKNRLKIVIPILEIPMGWFKHFCSVWTSATPRKNLKIFFIEHERFYGRNGLYGESDYSYGDNLERFAMLSRASLEIAKFYKFVPDIIHSNDWQTALVPVFLRELEKTNPFFKKTKTLLTIHNMGYQGDFPVREFPLTGLYWDAFYRRSFEFYGKLNFLKAGLYNADKISTVSPSYAREILTYEGGWSLDGVLRDRKQDLVGILNGVDYSIWNPATDKLIPFNYDVNDIENKMKCKLELQKRTGLPQSEQIPLFGVISRFAYQKGIDVLAQVIPKLLLENIQFIILGDGDSYLEHIFGILPRHYPEKCASYIGYNNELSHMIEAGADFFIMPSRYEPCGLNQMYSLKYGTLPVVRKAGGLADTVENLDVYTGKGNGFVFNDLSQESLLNTIKWAYNIWRERPDFISKMRRAAMECDFSWKKSAISYMNLFKEMAGMN